MKYVSVFMSNLRIYPAGCIKWIDWIQWNNRPLLVPNCYEVVAVVAISVRYGCIIVMHTHEINKAVSQWLLTIKLCVYVTWLLTLAFHIPWTHTPEIIINMHKGVCDNMTWTLGCVIAHTHSHTIMIDTCGVLCKKTTKRDVKMSH